MDALFGVQGLTVRFGGITAVDGVDLTVEDGQLVGLIGPNGAGKTTFIDAVTGLVRSRGRITFGGHDLTTMRAHQRNRTGLTRTFQSLELFEDLTVRENLLACAEESHWYSPVVGLFRAGAESTAGASVDAALATVGLENVSGQYPPSLSLGQRKLVTVARALASDPRMLLLDEPAAGLDSTESQELGAELKQLHDRGLTILLVDHDMDLVLGICDYIYVLEFGKLIASGTPTEIRNDERVIHAYLGAADEDEADQQDHAEATT